MSGAAGSCPSSRVTLHGVGFDVLTETEVVHRIAADLARGIGGQVITPNIDILRQAVRDADARALVNRASLVVADGMPIVWGARLLRRPLPERVTGASLIWSLSEAMAREGRSIYLLGGGPPGVPEQAARRLAEHHPGLRIAGAYAPPMGFDADPRQVERVRDMLVDSSPDLVFVGLGFPRQDRLAALLRADLPGSWFVGCGAAITFAAGELRRAPEWMQRTGLEWLHRLTSEPARLFNRYIVHDLPFAARFLTRCLAERWTGHDDRTASGPTR